MEFSEPNIKGNSYYRTCLPYYGGIINARSVFNISSEQRTKLMKKKKPNNPEGTEPKFASNNDNFSFQSQLPSKKNKYFNNKDYDNYRPKKEAKKTILKRKPQN